MGTQPLVLVADDERRITKLVSMALRDEGFRVVTASGGEEDTKALRIPGRDRRRLRHDPASRTKRWAE